MSSLEIFIYRYLEDNYGFLLHAPSSNETVGIDCGDAKAMQDVLQEKGWRLTHLFITHHHGDHTDGIKEIKEKTNCKIYGPMYGLGEVKIEGIEHHIKGGDSFMFGDCPVEVLHTPGHTLDMLNYYFPSEKAIFTGDTLFALGCGRLFEGDGNLMCESMKKFSNLPKDTKIYFGHEYTLANGKFALSIESENKDLIERMKEVELLCSAGEFTVPSVLAQEYATNPFLRFGEKSVRKSLNMLDASDEDVFTEIRKRKDNF